MTDEEWEIFIRHDVGRVKNTRPLFLAGPPAYVIESVPNLIFSDSTSPQSDAEQDSHVVRTGSAWYVRA